ncbi:TetR/AcrR family transcriptional regulator [Corynebacterium liangguodongii]|uniref:Transcriptional regulator n=1 Tax=Corynebacterium liangguodongii TaxID=2079535 RepID=A0A2S0WH25_9CORY|nr:TetR/AcrR family transcriptional regulator [Corynebacterium liangguodongii]AWB85026.1 transcriptional regulator [Corynebacterium liangguodongii]PWB99599.1 TetR/AcrR family transcriptional regulator [Corynebacterium liangguodongii]
MTRELTTRQRELFDTLKADFLAEGFESFTIDSAVKRYHCSKSTIYALGGSRDEIIRRVLISFFQDIARATAPTAESPALALRKYFAAMSEALAPVSPTFARDLAVEAVAQEVYSVNTAAAVATIKALINAGIESGEFSTPSPEFIAALIYRTMSDIQQGEYAEDIGLSAAYRELGRLILGGIAAH